MSDHITVIINFQTPDLTKQAVDSFRRHYPYERLLLIDNGSRDESAFLLTKLQSEFPNQTEILLNRNNIHHGPAMDQALRHVQIPYVAFLDSDCIVTKIGFLELMYSLLIDNNDYYIVGKRVFMNRRGFDVSSKTKAFPYVRPSCMILKRDLYFSLPPFHRHGTPCLANMRAATERGYSLIDFPINEYIFHKGRGTAERFGYQLGWRGEWNHILNKLGL